MFQCLERCWNWVRDKCANCQVYLLPTFFTTASLCTCRCLSFWLHNLVQDQCFIEDTSLLKVVGLETSSVDIAVTGEAEMQHPSGWLVIGGNPPLNRHPDWNQNPFEWSTENQFKVTGFWKHLRVWSESSHGCSAAGSCLRFAANSPGPCSTFCWWIGKVPSIDIRCFCDRQWYSYSMFTVYGFPYFLQHIRTVRRNVG